MELRPAHFQDFFRAIHGSGHDPFPWQQELVDHLAQCNEWPDMLDLPTGAGKTAAMDAAVFHLALRADMPGTAALRIALVVDRRLVVDDAFGRAKSIATTLRSALCPGMEEHEVVREVARRLRGLAGEGAPPLIARRLRGGAPLEHDWARTPTQPTILCSTVDQIGSRLLFRGYGVSDRMKPIHAGLLGINSLILLDEAHLSEPFRQTLAAVRHIGGAGVRTALLSATPGVETKRPFGLSLADHANPVLKKRLEAQKRTKLLNVVRGDIATATKVFSDTARRIADSLRAQGVWPPAVGIVVNRIDLARSVFEALNGDNAYDATLMIGRARGVDRDRLVSKLAPFRTGAKDRPHAAPSFIIATQCLEVGVDLDLDGLVTQAASFDALRQRFGRLNRAGRQIPAEGAIIARAKDIDRKWDDPVYGDRIRLTWEALDQLAEGGVVDFGIEALRKRLEEVDVNQDMLAAKRSEAPVVMPAYLDLWSQTSPRPAADPDVGLFLHGAERTAAGVSIVWRGDVLEDDMADARRDGLNELFRLIPPRASEAVEVPLWAARAWLRREQQDSGAMSDAPERQRDGDVSARAANQKVERRVFRWAGTDDERTGPVRQDELQPGDMLIVPTKYGGCDRFGWAPNSGHPVQDVADDAAEPFWGRRCGVRIARDVVRTDAEWDRLSAVIADESIAGPDLVEGLLDTLPSTQAAEVDEEGIDNPVRDPRKPLEALRRPKGQIEVHFPYAGGRENGVVIVAKRGVEVEDARRRDDAAPATEDDSISYTSKAPISLEHHCHRVEIFVRHFARTLGLSEYADDLGLAAFLHDVGKVDPRFQLMLSGGDPWNRPEGTPLAKSGRSWSPGAGKRAGLPPGWRHEALSVRMAPAHSRFAEARDPALVLWLIGSHHGLGRPFFGFLDPAPEQELTPCLDVADWLLAAEKPGPQSTAFEFHGADWPSLFEDLKARYGIWGLAHMEAILRLADHRVSEEEGTP